MNAWFKKNNKIKSLFAWSFLRKLEDQKQKINFVWPNLLKLSRETYNQSSAFQPEDLDYIPVEVPVGRVVWINLYACHGLPHSTMQDQYNSFN